MTSLYCPECGRKFEVGSFRTCPEDGARLYSLARRPEDPLVGTVLDGRFRIDATLNKGGMGAVYRATQLSVNREVALKVLRPDLEAEELFVERFFREARVVADLSHPNIVRLIDFGQDQEKGVLYLVMELVRGTDLSELLTRGRLKPALALEVTYQICAALTEPHSRGIIHRDLKPANVILLPISDGTVQVKVLDFGIARSAEIETQLTQTGVICGTPSYMSPEQAQNDSVDPRTDLYSLGVILFEMLTGHLPFAADSGLQVLMEHIQRRPPDLGQAYPELFANQISILVADLMEKNRAARPMSALEVRRRIDELRKSLGLRPVHLLAGIRSGSKEEEAAVFDAWILEAFDRTQTIDAGTPVGMMAGPERGGWTATGEYETPAALSEVVPTGKVVGPKRRVSPGILVVTMLVFLGVLAAMLAFFTLGEGEREVQTHFRIQTGPSDGDADADARPDNVVENLETGAEEMAIDESDDAKNKTSVVEGAKSEKVEFLDDGEVDDAEAEGDGELAVVTPEVERREAIVAEEVPVELETGGRVVAQDAGGRGEVYEGSFHLDSPARLEEAARYSEITGDLTIGINSDRVRDVALPRLTRVRGSVVLNGVSNLTSVALPSLTTIGGDLMGTQGLRLEALELSKLTHVGRNLMFASTELDGVFLPALGSVGGMVTVSDNGSLRSVRFENLREVGQSLIISENPVMSNLQAPQLREVAEEVMIASPGLQTVHLERLESIGGGFIMAQNAALEVLRLDRLVRVGSQSSRQAGFTLMNAPRLSDLRLQGLREVKNGVNLSQLGEVRSLDLRSLQGIGDQLVIMENPAMERLHLPNLRDVQEVIVNNNAALQTVELRELRGSDDLILVENPRLEACPLAGPLKAGGWSGTFTAANNQDGYCHSE